jgi:ribosome-binding factor A
MGRASEKRKARVKSLLLQTLSDIVREELDDPRLQLFSFTDILLAKDLASAEVKVAAVGGAEASARCVTALTAATPLIWNRLRAEVDLRVTPQLRFSVDLGPQYVDEIERLLGQIPPPAADGTGDLEGITPVGSKAEDDD